MCELCLGNLATWQDPVSKGKKKQKALGMQLSAEALDSIPTIAKYINN